MGEYLTLLNQVKTYIYAQRLDGARDALKRLLNSLNIDYQTAKNPTDKEKVRKAITRLLPALDELKKGTVTEVSIFALQLDRSRLTARYGGTKEELVIPPPPQIPPQYGSYTNVRPANGNGAGTAYGANGARPVETPKAPQTPGAYAPQAGATQPAKKPVMGGKKPAGRSNNVMIPLTLDDYIGQEKAKRSLRISIAAAKKTGTPLAHLLICSPYGLGKTTLANIIANEVGMPFFNVNATNLKDVRSLSLYFSKIQDSCIIFIDEIHTLKKEVQTVLLSIMTDFTVNFIDENGEEQHYDLPQFTLIGATTQAGELLKPFLNRFAVLELEDYTDDEKHILVESKFKKLGYEATEEAIDAISRRCRGVPRTIETYAKGIIDVALTRDETVITEETTDIYFEIHEIDDNGLTKNDIKILKILDEAAKPLALVTIESKSGIQKEDIEYRYEPYMIKLGLMDKTDRGRIITRKGIKYLHPELDDGKDGEADEGVDNGEQPETDEPVDTQPEAAQPADTQGEEPEYYDPSDDGDILDQAERALDGDSDEQSDSSSFFDAIKDDDGKEGE